LPRAGGRWLLGRAGAAAAPSTASWTASGCGGSLGAGGEIPGDPVQAGGSVDAGEISYGLPGVVDNLKGDLIGILVERVVQLGPARRVLTGEPPLALAEPAVAPLLHVPTHDGVRLVEMGPGLERFASHLA